MCLAGPVVASWSLTQEVAGSSAFNDKYFYSLYSVKTLRKNCNEAHRLSLHNVLVSLFNRESLYCPHFVSSNHEYRETRPRVKQNILLHLYFNT